MSNIFLYNTPILPDGFVFPQSYIDTVKSNNIIDLEPWDFLCKDMGKSLSYYGALLIEYRDQPLIPFAIASDESGFLMMDMLFWPVLMKVIKVGIQKFIFMIMAIVIVVKIRLGVNNII